MSNKKKVNILLVDDQPSNLAVLDAVLSELGEVLVSVTSGELALRQVLEDEFAVILMDVQMPTMSGLETAEMLRQHPRSRTVPIIFLTANHDDQRQVEQAYVLGAVDYLTKPINPIILRSKVAVFIDLHRKTAEIARHAELSHLAALRTRDQRIRLILDNTRDYAFIGTDPDGIVTEWEGGAENITGWWADSARGQPGAIIFTPEDRASGRPQAEMRQARETGRAEDRRWHVRRDGTRFFADGVMVPLRDDQDLLRGYAKIFRDATAERLAAEQLQQSEAQLGESRQRSRRAEENLLRLAAVAEQSSDFIGIATPDARKTYLNLAGRALAGVAQQADIGAYGVTDFFDPESGAFMQREVLPAIRGGAGKWEGELRMRHLASGAVFPVYYKGFAVRDADGAFIAIATITRDITEQKRAEDALRRIADDLAQADRRKSEFLATLAHELRNPLAPIRSGLDLLRLSAVDAAGAKIHAMMDRQLGHLVHLVNDLLDVARITRGKIELKKEAADLAAIVAMALETSAGMITAGGHALDVQVPQGVLLVDADVTRMVQVVSNLLNNAAKYTPAGGSISLVAWSEDGSAVLAVTDTGVGIPAEAMPTLFDMFTQVGASAARAQGGLGIGLSLVQRLVQLHDGAVSAASAGRGQGSTFTVRLPLRSAAGTSKAPAVVAEACGDALRILVVDDNADAANSLAALLGIMGHSTRTAQDGAAGLAVAQAFAPQLAFLDIGMPGMNGHELARRLRAASELAPLMLVALTGWGTHEDVAQSQAAGFDLHLTKPVDVGALGSVFSAFAQARP